MKLIISAGAALAFVAGALAADAPAPGGSRATAGSTIINPAAVPTNEYPILKLGETAPDFSLKGVDGRLWSLKDFASAKILIVMFTCNHCPTVLYYEERIKQLVNDYKDKGVMLVAINPNFTAGLRDNELGYTDLTDSYEANIIRAKNHAYNYPYLWDGDTQETSRKYGPYATPHLFIFDAERKLRFQGMVDDEQHVELVKVKYARMALDAILESKEPPITSTHVQGCTTKWISNGEDVARYMATVKARPVTLSPVDPAGLEAIRRNGTDRLQFVAFYNSSGPNAVTHMAKLMEINRWYGHRNFTMITVATNQPGEAPAVLDFLKAQHAGYQVPRAGARGAGAAVTSAAAPPGPAGRNLILGAGDHNAMIKAFNPSWGGRLPFYLIIAPDGTILHREEGSVSDLPAKTIIYKALNVIRPY